MKQATIEESEKLRQERLKETVTVCIDFEEERPAREDGYWELPDGEIIARIFGMQGITVTVDGRVHRVSAQNGSDYQLRLLIDDEQLDD